MRDKHGKRIDGGVLMGAQGLDDGLDATRASAHSVVPHT